jgi:two-component system phosphate regulon sensor histidine kinase PhoR
VRRAPRILGDDDRAEPELVVEAAEILAALPRAILVVDRELELKYANAAADALLGRDGGSPGAGWPELSVREHARDLFAGERISRIVQSRGRTISLTGVVSADGATATLVLEDLASAERIDRLQREFVENAAHELRTPVAAIAGAVEVLEGGAKNDPAVRDRFLAHIRNQSDRLVRLADTLLVLARIQSGAERAQVELVPVRKLLDEIAEPLEPAPGVRVNVHAADDLCVVAEPNLLRQALDNIAWNAVSHTKAGEIVLEGRDVGEHAELVVRDTGPGMSALEQAHAFERFYRAAGPSKTHFGLGLAIAEGAVNAVGGAIELASREDVGTEVLIRLPSARLVSP